MQPYSELLSPDGTIRAPMRPLVEYLRRERRGQGEEMRRTVAERLGEQEVSYNLLGTPGGSARPWQVDEIPQVLAAAEFGPLSKQLEDRAQLLSACINDLYGNADLVRSGTVPSGLYHGNPNYYRALRALPRPAVPLILYAADVIRSPDGTFVVHSDRSAAPTGAGYALENRLVVGQLLGEPFRAQRVAKVNTFFNNMRQAIEALSPRSGQVPRVVVLTPGIADESSFEHAYLARYLGYELVEGRDLTVRADEVFLKTLDGLQRVDVIVRRVTDGYCDPLELRDDSFIGVSGLLSAVRAGKVGIANPLGVGLIESPAFRAYLPQMAQALGLPLGLQSVPTRYLGDPRHRAEVEETLDQWLIRPAFSDRREPARRAPLESAAEKDALRAQIAKDGHLLVAEQWPAASLVPLGLEMARTGAFSLRLFACHTGLGYSVMPGGLGRVDDTPDGLFLHPTQRATSKDVWIVGSQDEAPPALPRMPEKPLRLRRGGVNVPSRLFDDIYWLGRYTTRAAATVRFLRVTLTPSITEGVDASPVGEALFSSVLTSLQALEGSAAARPWGERMLLAINSESPSSLTNCLTRIHQLAAEGRSRLSIDTWNCLRQIASWRLGSDTSEEAVAERLNELHFWLAAFHGITTTSMVRGPAWLFLDLGRGVEQAVIALTLIAETFRQGASPPYLKKLLRGCDSLMTYRARYLSSLQPAAAADLVLTDDTNPQSVLYQVKSLRASLRALSQEEDFPLSPAMQGLVRLESELLTVDLFDLTRGSGEALMALCDKTVHGIWQFSDELTHAYFAHANQARLQRQAERNS